MKSITNWAEPNTGATNESGFSALPGGGNTINGYYQPTNGSAFFWSSTENLAFMAWSRNLSYTEVDGFRDDVNKNYGFSVRCIKD